MTYLPHLKISVFGRLGSTYADAVETWSVGLRWMVNSGPFPALDQDAMDQCAIGCVTPTTAFINDTTFMNNVFLEGIKAYRIGPDGKAVGAIGAAFSDGTVRGSGSANFAPYQIADVLSLVADGRGKGKYGRIYLPGINAGVDGTGLRPPAQPAALMAKAKTWLTAMDAALGQSTKVGQDVSLCVAGTTGTGTLRPVGTLRWGHVPDTQRRRRRQLVEAYAVTSYPA